MAVEFKATHAGRTFVLIGFAKYAKSNVAMSVGCFARDMNGSGYIAVQQDVMFIHH